ncbi:RNA polymerase sigma factor [Alienimonas sp. DA493]|uniref:RNA polymerase sigma factor n=1 Tax=Alienimonas sp. DA493 TaxID=3373605 RepID=UPI0037544273
MPTDPSPADCSGSLAAPLPGWLRSVVAGRVGDADLAEDVLQEVALAEARTAPGGVPPAERRGPWLYRVALRQAAFALRTAGRRRRRERAAAAPDRDAGPPPLATLLHAETADLLRAALAELPPADRDVLTLCHMEGLTYAGIAERLGVSVHCVEDRLRRGRGRLRRALARRGVREP